MKTDRKTVYLNSICILLILLWTYTAISKLMDIEEFKRQLYNQTFGRSIANLLIWLLPSTELCAAILLCFKKSRSIGLLLSFSLMLLFSVYIGLVLLNYYGRTPCACGGVLSGLGWKAHFWFNIGYLLLAGYGVWLEHHFRHLKK